MLANDLVDVRDAGNFGLHLPGHGACEDFLDGDTGGLVARSQDTGLGPRLQLFRALRRDDDEAELAVDLFGENEMLHLDWEV